MILKRANTHSKELRVLRTLQKNQKCFMESETNRNQNFQSHEFRVTRLSTSEGCFQYHHNISVSQAVYHGIKHRHNDEDFSVRRELLPHTLPLESSICFYIHVTLWW